VASVSEIDSLHMARALELARRGEGLVEPNPMVGCVIADYDEVIGEGWHRRFGFAHAEVEALAAVGPRARGATAYVTLEPCCHFGKTAPCTQALIAAGIRRVVAALADPFPQISGRGFRELTAAGIEVEIGLMESEARRLNAPYLKRVATGRPWVIAKWAMTLDGKLATRSGDSRWISGPESREIVHQLRGRVDAILIGRGTAVADDP
jgi:diaminohydroxyphosphoribosylaminopyrimidine deaminase / 5-amino-6-(5-phosphoribosylamino)uracil reductase